MKDLTGRFPEKYTVAMEAGLEPCEVETGFYFNRATEDDAIINTNDPAIVSRLITSDFFVLENWRGDQKKNGEIEIHYVDGRIPIGSILISKPRAKNTISAVVKSPRKEYSEEEKEANRTKMAERLSGGKKKGKE